MKPGMPVSSILHCKYNCHKGTFLELFQAICRLKPTFIEAHHASKKICKVRSLKSRIKTHSFFEEIITSSKEVFKDFVSDMAVEIRKLGNRTQKIPENNDTVKQTAGS